MAKVYAVDKQQSIHIGNYGFATHDTPCLVPDELATQLEKEPALRVEKDQALTMPGVATKPQPAKKEG
jgi:hypothetical protein